MSRDGWCECFASRRGGRAPEVPEAAGEVSLEAADGQAPRAIFALHLFENSAPPGSESSGQRSCRLHCSVLLSSRAHEGLAVVDQQPQVELGPGERRARERVDARRHGGARDRDPVDAVGLAALAGCSGACRPSTASRCERRERRVRRGRSETAPARPRPTVLQRPDRSASSARAQINGAANPRAPTPTVIAKEQRRGCELQPPRRVQTDLVCEPLCQ
jgi:hypothetical protein